MECGFGTCPQTPTFRLRCRLPGVGNSARSAAWFFGHWFTKSSSDRGGKVASRKNLTAFEGVAAATEDGSRSAYVGVPTSAGGVGALGGAFFFGWRTGRGANSKPTLPSGCLTRKAEKGRL